MDGRGGQEVDEEGSPHSLQDLLSHGQHRRAGRPLRGRPGAGQGRSPGPTSKAESTAGKSLPPPEEGAQRGWHCPWPGTTRLGTRRCCGWGSSQCKSTPPSHLHRDGWYTQACGLCCWPSEVGSGGQVGAKGAFIRPRSVTIPGDAGSGGHHQIDLLCLISSNPAGGWEFLGQFLSQVEQPLGLQSPSWPGEATSPAGSGPGKLRRTRSSHCCSRPETAVLPSGVPQGEAQGVHHVPFHPPGSGGGKSSCAVVALVPQGWCLCHRV